MARVKPQSMINTKAQAEEAMAKIDAIDRQFADWDLAEAEAVIKVREKFAEKRQQTNYIGLQAERSLLIKELEGFADRDCGTWEKKTFETPFGCFGFRITPPTVALVKRVSKTYDRAVESLEFEKMTEFIRTKKEVDKEAILAAHKEGTLDALKLEVVCGLKVKQEDEFWLESRASKDLDEAAKKLRAA